MVGIASMFLGLVYFYFFSALNYRFFLQINKLITEDDAFRKFYSIRKLRMNLIDIKIQFIYPNFVIYRVFIGQGLNVFFQLYYNELGPENIFNIWWTSFFLENIGKILYKSVQLSIYSLPFFNVSGSRFFFNIWIYINAMKRIPEFSGLQGKTFPGM